MRGLGHNLETLAAALGRKVSPDARPKCDKCDDTEWVEGEDGVIRCDCWWTARIRRLLAEASIPEGYEHCRINTFDTEGRSDSVSRARDRVANWILDFRPQRRGLLLRGPQGTGKTHLAVAALRACVERARVRGFFAEYGALLHELETSIRTNQPAAPILSPVIHADVLVLDDLGRRRPSEWTEDTIATVLGERYMRRRTTIFTSNHPDDGSDQSLEARVGPRVRSRVYEMADLVVVEGDDYRRTMGAFL